MPDSPAAATPYEVLGVSATATHDELRRAYRRSLRQTHPDVGGSPARFHAVQVAWERIGTPTSRASYDGARFRNAEPQDDQDFGSARSAGTSGSASSRSSRSAPQARMHGHPGGQARLRYLSSMREWAGRGATVDDPYAPDLIRSAPREIRHSLAKAVAEESTAQLVSRLGIGFTAWHDVVAGDRGEKLDHVVLGPAGLFAVMSEDWGGAVELRRGELTGESLDGATPIHALQHAARAFTRALRVRFTALVIVVPDDALVEPILIKGRGRHPAVVTVPRSRLVVLLREGLPGMERGAFEKVFELRSRLQNGIRFVAA